MTTTTKKKTVSHAKSLPPPAVIAEVHLIALERIEIGAQVRTEFDEASIIELAADIETNGLLQPVLVNPCGDERYRLICGERRLRAIRHLGHKAIPAVITKIEDKAARLMQLAENIQREEMSTKDEVHAVRALFDEIGNMGEVARMLSKSKPWVSKRIAASRPDLSWQAKNMLDNGETDDLEIINTVDQMARLNHTKTMLARQLARAGELTREKARDMLKEAKELAKHEADEMAKKRKESGKEKKKDTKPPKVFDAAQEMRNIEREIVMGKMTATEIKSKYSPEQWSMVENTLTDCHVAGLEAKASGNAVVALAKAIELNNGYGCKLVAILRAYMECELNLLHIIEDNMESLK